MINTENFIQEYKDDNFDVDLFNVKPHLLAKYKDQLDIESEEDIDEVNVSTCRVKWDFALECRSWGVKSFTCYATEVVLSLLVEIVVENTEAHWKTKEVELEMDISDFVLDSEVSPDFTGQFSVDNIQIDFGQRDIIVNINR